MKTSYCHLFLFTGLVASQFLSSCHADPTNGFTAIELTEANFEIQRPYDIPVNERYSFQDGVRRLWVYASDKPHTPNSHTQPRTEIKITDHYYSSGVWQFEADGFVPKGTSGVTIFQIFGAPKKIGHATALMLQIYDGNMKHYNRELVAPNIYDKWFRLNVIHDADRRTVTVFIDGARKFSTVDKGPAQFFFKYGVYATPAKSSYMESRWRNVNIYKN